MGAAAEHRGNAAIHRSIYAEIDEQRNIEELVRASQIAEDCNEFVRQAMAYMVEPKGLRQSTIEASKTRRGWSKRNDDVVAAHNMWVDTAASNAFAYHHASVKRAKAVYSLFVFALRGWSIPLHIKLPRAVK